MPKQAKKVVPPKPGKGGRPSILQKELLEALDILRSGNADVVEDGENRYYYIALDREKVKTAQQAKAALYNLRWKAKRDSELMKRYFQHARGAIKIEEQGDELIVFAPESYSEKSDG